MKLLVIALVMSLGSNVLACTEKDSEACIKTAYELMQKRDNEKAVELLEKGCGFGNARACLKAGVMAEKAKKWDDAKKFYQKSCDLNKAKDCPNVKIIEGKSK